MANKVYPNFVLENQFEDQYNSKLDLMRFCTVDSSLEMSPGMTVKINKYHRRACCRRGQHKNNRGNIHADSIRGHLSSEPCKIPR